MIAGPRGARTGRGSDDFSTKASTNLSTTPGCERAKASATMAPRLNPNTSAFSIDRYASSASMSSAKHSSDIACPLSAVRPWPCNSMAMTSWFSVSGGSNWEKLAAMFNRLLWRSTRAGPWPWRSKYSSKPLIGAYAPCVSCVGSPAVPPACVRHQWAKTGPAEGRAPPSHEARGDEPSTGHQGQPPRTPLRSCARGRGSAWTFSRPARRASDSWRVSTT